MNNIIKILMERDELTEREAKEVFDEAKEMIVNNPDEAEDIMMEWFGLEMDYIFDVIF